MAWGPKKEREVLPKKSSELEPKLLLNAMVSVAQHHEHPKLLIAACIGSADAYGNKQADKHFEGRYAFLQQPAPVRIYSSSGANSALVRLVQDDDGKFRLMVAFRGTVLENDSQSKDFSASVINILQDLDFRQTHMSFESLNSCKTLQGDAELPRVHCGFHNALSSIYPQIIAAIRQFLKDDVQNKICRERIIVTGHSLGGAMAKLFTFSLIEHEKNLQLDYKENFQVACVTFGEPQPGDQTFADCLERWKQPAYQLPRSRLISFRVATFLDAVPKLLSTSTAIKQFPDYAHSGELIVLDNPVIQTAWMIFEVVKVASAAETVFEGFKDGVRGCMDTCVDAHSIDTQYAPKLASYLAANGIGKMDQNLSQPSPSPTSMQPPQCPPRSAEDASTILEKAIDRVPFGEKKGTAQKDMMQMLQRFPFLQADTEEYVSFSLLRYFL